MEVLINSGKEHELMYTSAERLLWKSQSPPRKKTGLDWKPRELLESFMRDNELTYEETISYLMKRVPALL